MDLSATMSILEFPCSLSKYSWLHLYNVIANILFPLILALQLTMFLFLAMHHLQLSDIFLGKVDQTPSMKGFIPIESDRAHVSSEVEYACCSILL